MPRVVEYVDDEIDGMSGEGAGSRYCRCVVTDPEAPRGQQQPIGSGLEQDSVTVAVELTGDSIAERRCC